MSLLKRIESARPGAGGMPDGSSVPVPAPGGGGVTPAAPAAPRLMSQTPTRESFRDVKFRIQNRVIQDLDPKLDLSNQVEVRRQIEEIFGKVIDEEGLALTRAERVRMLEQITDEIIGLGPLEPLLRDESITEIMVNGPRQVYIERSGKLELTNVVFQNDDHVMRIIDRIIAPIDPTDPTAAIARRPCPPRSAADRQWLRRDRRTSADRRRDLRRDRRRGRCRAVVAEPWRAPRRPGRAVARLRLSTRRTSSGSPPGPSSSSERAAAARATWPDSARPRRRSPSRRR